VAYTLNQTDDEMYDNYKDYIGRINDKMKMCNMTLFAAIKDDMEEQHVVMSEPAVEEYFWSLGIPFGKIENFTKWFVDQACCPDK